jgi:uncharacterized protein YhbP (UPF0306 family)
MIKDLEKITNFINQHHVLSLATTDLTTISVCSLFYVYSPQDITFVVASDDDTTHIRHIKNKNNIAGNILLETKTIGKIQGLQFYGEFFLLEDDELSKLYFKKFPYALAMQPKLWQIKVSYFKLTDNRLGFGKKIIWQDSSL